MTRHGDPDQVEIHHMHLRGTQCESAHNDQITRTARIHEREEAGTNP